MHRLSIEKPRRARRVTLVALVDLVIILLIFFMLRTNFLDPRQVALDPATPAAPEQVPVAPLKIELHANGSAWIDGAEVGAGGLARVLAGRAPAPDQRAVIVVDEGVSMQRAVDAIDTLRAADWNAISLERARRFSAVASDAENGA
jgi:biopolymer transport protein ExbD